MIDEYELISIQKKQSRISNSVKQAKRFPANNLVHYVYEEHYVSTITNTVGFLRQLDIEFPTVMKNKIVLAKIQEQLIDTLLHTSYHTLQLDETIAKCWRAEKRLSARCSIRISYPMMRMNITVMAE